MRRCDILLPSLAENLALDEALLLSAEAGTSGEVLRFWEWPHLAVVVGAGGRISEEVNLAQLEADGVAILRRASGGGTVLLGPGCLLFTLILSHERDPALQEIRPSYRFILGRIAESLRNLLPGIEPSGISDLAASGRYQLTQEKYARSEWIFRR
jgi:lipoate-protein ligase A